MPLFLQPILWSSNIGDLDLKKHRDYIIHQILMYGSFKQLSWLFNAYSKKELVNTFLKTPQKVYTKPAFRFAKNFLLNLDKINLDEEQYVISFYGPVRPRAAKGFSPT